MGHGVLKQLCACLQVERDVQDVSPVQAHPLVVA